MVVAAGGSEKAFFLNVDENKAFYVQFNPKELKVDEKATWTQSDEQEASRPPLTYDKGLPTTIQMDLFFDTTDTLDDANALYVEPLRSFLTSSIDDTDEEENAVTRPPFCTFVWGPLSFDCIVEQVTSTFLMFLSDGTPVRCKVTVILKERERPDLRIGDELATTLAGASSVFAAVSTVTAAPGQTLASVAQANKVPMSDLADANGLSDPFADLGGQTLVVPGNSALAAQLAASSRTASPARWQVGVSSEGLSGAVSGPPMDDSVFDSAMDNLGLVLASAAAGGAVAGAIGGSSRPPSSSPASGQPKAASSSALGREDAASQGSRSGGAAPRGRSKPPGRGGSGRSGGPA